MSQIEAQAASAAQESLEQVGPDWDPPEIEISKSRFYLWEGKAYKYREAHYYEDYP